MRSRASLRRLAAALLVAGSVLSSATMVTASSVGSQQAKVDAYAAQLNDLQDRIGQLDEDLGAAQDKKAQLDQDIADSQAKIAQQQARLDEISGVLGNIAVDKYVRGSALELSPLFSNAQSYTDAAQKDSLSRLAIDSGAGTTDEMQALAEDLAREQASLTRKQQQATDLVNTLNSKLAEAQTLQTEYDQKYAAAKAELGVLIDQERERRAEAAAQAELQRQREAAAAAAANSQKSAAVSTPRGGGTGGATPSTPAPDPAPSGGSGGGGAPDPAPAPPPAPPVSSAAGIAVAAAQSQLGVPYQFAAESPGVAFDCSGLTKYAWGQAGVYLPHQSAMQYASIPHITQAEIQPGDLVFYKTPIGHVGIYIGGGQMIHAPFPGEVVSVAAVNWGKVVGIGRPG